MKCPNCGNRELKFFPGESNYTGNRYMIQQKGMYVCPDTRNCGWKQNSSMLIKNPHFTPNTAKYRFKVVKLKYNTDTVNTADPTCVRKNTGIEVISYHPSLQLAVRKVEKLNEQQSQVYEEMSAYHAPSECYSVIEKRDLYIVDRYNKIWYEMRQIDDAGNEGPVPVEPPKGKTDWEM